MAAGLPQISFSGFSPIERNLLYTAVTGGATYFGASYLNSLPLETCYKTTLTDFDKVPTRTYWIFPSEKLVPKEVELEFCDCTAWGSALSSMKELTTKVTDFASENISLGAACAAAFTIGVGIHLLSKYIEARNNMKLL